MSEIVLFIDVETLKKRTGLHDNVDEKLIYPEVRVAQDQLIAPILGTALYNKLLTLVKEGTIAQEANAPYKALLDDYLIPALCWYVVAAIPASMNYQLTNRGMVQKTTDNTQAPSINEMFQMMDHYRRYAEGYQAKAIRYLKRVRLPEYESFGTGVDDLAPEQGEYTAPTALGEEYDHKHRSYLGDDYYPHTRRRNYY